MGFRCEIIGKYVLPIFRSLVAKELINTYDLTQVEIANKLGTTQAAISHYINSKRALKDTEQIDKVLPKIREMAIKNAKRLARDEMPHDDLSADICKLCSFLFEVVTSKIDDDYVI